MKNKAQSVSLMNSSRLDIFLPILFAVLFCMYSFFVLFSNRWLGFAFFAVSTVFLYTIVFKKISRKVYLSLVFFMISALFFSRLVWSGIFLVLPLTFYPVIQTVFILIMTAGIVLLYRQTVKEALFGKKRGHIIHISYFAAGSVIFPFIYIYSYGALLKQDAIGALGSLFILVVWGCMYLLQMIGVRSKVADGSLYTANLAIAGWAIYRWSQILP